MNFSNHSTHKHNPHVPSVYPASAASGANSLKNSPINAGAGAGPGAGPGTGTAAADNAAKLHDADHILVTDSACSHPDQLLNAYIYDYLVKTGLTASSRAFFQEANVPISKNGEPLSKATLSALQLETPPKLGLSMDSPSGFLLEWWEIFWEMFNAKSRKPVSQKTQFYYNLDQQMRAKSASLLVHAQSADQQQPAQPHMQPQLQLQPVQQQPMQQQQQPVQQFIKNGQIINSIISQSSAGTLQLDYSNLTGALSQRGQQQQQHLQARSPVDLPGIMNDGMIMHGHAPPQQSPIPEHTSNNTSLHSTPAQISPAHMQKSGAAERNTQFSDNNISILRDYQLQLIMLEKQNKKNLEIFRTDKHESADGSSSNDGQKSSIGEDNVSTKSDEQYNNMISKTSPAIPAQQSAPKKRKPARKKKAAANGPESEPGYPVDMATGGTENNGVKRKTAATNPNAKKRDLKQQTTEAKPGNDLSSMSHDHNNGNNNPMLNTNMTSTHSPMLPGVNGAKLNTADPSNDNGFGNHVNRQRQNNNTGEFNSETLLDFTDGDTGFDINFYLDNNDWSVNQEIQ